MTTPIEKTLDVACAPAAAFDLFTRRMSSWWPLDAHAVSAGAGKAAQAVTVEPRVGGAIYETMHDGGRAEWGEVLVYEPGAHFAMTWRPGNPADKATRVEVSFVALAGGGTRVTLVHSGWEILADAAEDRRRNYDSGWDFVLGRCFGQAAGG